MCAAVVACRDTSPVFELCEEVLDFVALTVERFVVIERVLSASCWRNARFGSARFERRAESVAVIALVGDQRFGLRQGAEHKPRAPVIAHLTFGQHHDERLAALVADDMPLGVQPAFRAADTASKNPFLEGLPPCDARSDASSRS